jgi:phosphatidylglycerophosphate synthase
MSGDRIKSSDCYSAGERASMERTQAIRAALLRPILNLLTRWSIRADGITLASLIAGLAFVPLFPRHPLAALFALAVHALLDGVDGCLARHQGLASPKGSFTDTLSDQCVLTGVMLVVSHQGMLACWMAGLFLFAYTLVVTFAMVRNALEVPYHWLVRPRFAIYLAIPLQLWGQWPILTPLTYICTALLGIKAWTGFVAIRRAL